MTIQEAIRSNKPIRRKGWPDEGIWYSATPGNFVFKSITDGTRYSPTVDDILAEDWEVLPV